MSLLSKLHNSARLFPYLLGISGDWRYEIHDHKNTGTIHSMKFSGLINIFVYF